MKTPHNTLNITTLDDVRNVLRCIVDCAEVQRHRVTQHRPLRRITFEELQALRVRFIVQVTQLAESLEHGNGAYLVNALLPPAELIDFDGLGPQQREQLLDWPSLPVDIDISAAAVANIADLSDTVAGGVFL